MTSFAGVAPLQWTTKQCTDWLATISVPNGAAHIAAMIKMFNENEYSGEELIDLCCEAKDLRDELKGEVEPLKLGICGKICAQFQIIQRANSGGNPFDNIIGDDGENAPDYASDSFTIWVMGIPHKQMVKIHGVTVGHTVADLKQMIRDQEGVDKFGLTGLADDNKKLGQYSLRNESIVHHYILNPGGTSDPNANNNSNNVQRHINWAKYPQIKKTKKADCLYGRTMKEGYSVAKMECGHAMESDGMFKWIEFVFGKHLSVIKMECPMTKCKREWDWQTCCRVAGMTDAEYLDFTRKKDVRSNVTMRECPHCGVFCKRQTNVVILRMACNACKKQHWCWVCSKLWRGSGLIVCNNADCIYVSALNKQLAECRKEVPYGWKDIQVDNIEDKQLPTVRACPFCLALIEKPRGCKHMKCRGCQKEFCFSCLKPGNVCTHAQYRSICQVAPRQQFT